MPQRVHPLVGKFGYQWAQGHKTDLASRSYVLKIGGRVHRPKEPVLCHIEGVCEEDSNYLEGTLISGLKVFVLLDDCFEPATTLVRPMIKIDEMSARDIFCLVPYT